MTWIGLFRGLNVGKINRIKMDELVNVLASIGLSNIVTYIQSGNVVFETSVDEACTKENVRNANKIEMQIDEALLHKMGIEAKVKILSKAAFVAIFDENPYLNQGYDAKQIHISLLFEPTISPQLGKLTSELATGEQYTLTPDAFYFYAPNGVGRSKCFQHHEKWLGVAVTSRNARTFEELREILMTSR